MNTLIKTDWCEVSQVGLRVVRAPTWDEFELEVWRWTAAHRLSAWAIADLLNYAERKWGETYAQVMDETGLSYGYIANIRSVASKISRKRRNPRLSFSHHATVAYLPPEEQDRWLAEAEDKCLSRNDLRDAVKGMRIPEKTDVVVIPKQSLRQVVASYVQATWEHDTVAEEDAWKKMVEMVKDLL